MGGGLLILVIFVEEKVDGIFAIVLFLLSTLGLLFVLAEGLIIHNNDYNNLSDIFY